VMEHIDASGRWLWKVRGGRDILLMAARNETNRILQRRTPEILRLPATEKIERLARYCHLDQEDLISALQLPACKQPIDFMRQIKTLQQLRKHHER
jgi:hypothetical protein